MEVNVFLDPGDSIIDICVGSGMQATELAKKKKGNVANKALKIFHFHGNIAVH